MKLLIILSVLVTTAYSYNILCVFPLPSRSHNQLAWGIVNALLNASHQVTWATPFPKEVKKNMPKSLKVIDVSGTWTYVNDVGTTKSINSGASLSSVKAFANNVSREALTTPELRDAIVTTQYDAVFTEASYSDVMAGLAAVQQVPWLLLSGTPLNPSLEALVDEVRSITTVPIFFNDCGIPMSLKDRLFNTFLYVAMSVAQWLGGSPTNKFYKTLFEPLAEDRGVPLPAFDEALNNVSILFVNSHESLTPAHSTPPNVINIGGFHIDEEIPPLPKDLQDILDRSPQGVVYFSMGAVIRSAAFPESTRKALLRHFGRLKQTVVWKYEAHMARQGLPPNVHVRTWIPQLSILAHPNVRVFITQGGFHSILEAVNAGVPLLAVPVFGDQSRNADRAVRAGYARKVKFAVDMADELVANLKEMLSNDVYFKKVKELSKLFRWRPVPPAKLIQHYTELAIETKGAYHIRSLSKKYAWYERWMVDQVAFILIVLAILVVIVLITVKTCFRKLKASDKKPVEQRKKKKQ